MIYTTIDNTQNTIDSRDVIDRVEELRDLRPIPPSDDDAEEDRAIIQAAFDEWEQSDEAEELCALEALQDDAEGYCPDWEYGAQLIRESYFEEAMDDMIADCYGDAYSKDLPCFMSIVIDYDALKQDYTEVTFDGVAYFVR